MFNLFLSLILPLSRPLFRNNDFGAERVFRTWSGKIFSRFSKSFSRGRLNLFITCEVYCFERFIGSGEQWDVCREVWSNFILLWSGSTRRHQICNVLAATRKANVQIFRYCFYFPRLLPVQTARYRDGCSRNAGRSGPKFRSTVSWFSQPTMHDAHVSGIFMLAVSSC